MKRYTMKLVNGSSQEIFLDFSTMKEFVESFIIWEDSNGPERNKIIKVQLIDNLKNKIATIKEYKKWKNSKK